MPIWYSTKICSYFNKEWFVNGISIVDDLFINGNFVTLDYLHNVKGVKCNFLEYESIRLKIANLHIPPNAYIRIPPRLPLMLRKISLGGKGCNRIYQIILQTSHNVILQLKRKWETLMNEEVNIRDIETGFSTIHDTKMCLQ